MRTSRVQGSVRLFAARLGQPFHTVRKQSWVAAAVANDFLRRLGGVAFKAMREPEARERVNEAQFEQADLLDEDEITEGRAPGRSDAPDSSRPLTPVATWRSRGSGA